MPRRAAVGRPRAPRPRSRRPRRRAWSTASSPRYCWSEPVGTGVQRSGRWSAEAAAGSASARRTIRTTARRTADPRARRPAAINRATAGRAAPPRAIGHNRGLIRAPVRLDAGARGAGMTAERPEERRGGVRGRPRRTDAGDAVGVAGPDDRLDRAADDRRRSRRAGAHLVGGDRVPAGDHRRHAALRQARRSLRAQGGAAGRARAVPHRLRAVRAGTGDDRVDRVPSDPGAWRRWADGQRSGRDRRRRLAARARPVHGPVRRRLRRLVGGRAADRRLLHLQPLVALDLLHQHPARSPRVRRAGGVAAERHPSACTTRSTTPERCCWPSG